MRCAGTLALATLCVLACLHGCHGVPPAPLLRTPPPYAFLGASLISIGAISIGDPVPKLSVPRGDARREHRR